MIESPRNMDFDKFLQSSAHQIDQELEIILNEFLNQTKRTNIKLLPLVLGFINACKGGKRIRGTLVRLGYEIVKQSTVYSLQSTAEDGRRKTEDIIKIGAALEILHTAILIHDDVIDQSPIRRGQSSLYKALGGDHYGISQAISLGDIGLYLPLKIITEANFLGELRLKAINHLTDTIIKTAWGQLLDVEITVKSGKRSEEDTKFINLFKTAKYSIAGPLNLGAILAGAEEELLGQLGLFGENLGIAFQIQDDILDGEITSLDYATALAYISKGKKIIPKLTKDPKMSKLLEQMADYLVERRK